MKCASLPSRYRYCMRRTSVRTGRNFSPARNVRSITAPSLARRSFVRTNAPPLPGFTCWNSRILKTVPSTSMWLPFLNWLVLITDRKASRRAFIDEGNEIVDDVSDDCRGQREAGWGVARVQPLLHRQDRGRQREPPTQPLLAGRGARALRAGAARRHRGSGPTPHVGPRPWLPEPPALPAR